MIRRTGFSAVIKILLVGFMSAWASFMFTPMITSGLISEFTASFLGVLMVIPLMLYFLDFMGEKITSVEYINERRWEGIIIDLLMTLLAGLAPAIILLYFQMNLGITSFVSVSSSTSIGVFVGYSAFLFRNHEFFEEEQSDIVL